MSVQTARFRRRLLTLGIVLACFGMVDDALALAYTATYLGDNFSPLQLNDRGEVLGTQGSMAVLWTDGTLQPLGTFAPIKLNNRGQVVGYQNNVPVLWTDGTLQSLGIPPGDTVSYLRGFNNSGDVVGTSCPPAGCKSFFGGGGPSYGHAFLWSDGVLQVFGNPEGGSSINFAYDAVGINDARQVLMNDCVFQDGGCDLTTGPVVFGPGVKSVFCDEGWAVSINNGGFAIDHSACPVHLWNVNTGEGFQVLDGEIFAINDSGIAIGEDLRTSSGAVLMNSCGEFGDACGIYRPVDLPFFPGAINEEGDVIGGPLPLVVRCYVRHQRPLRCEFEVDHLRFQ